MIPVSNSKKFDFRLCELLQGGETNADRLVGIRELLLLHPEWEALWDRLKDDNNFWKALFEWMGLGDGSASQNYEEEWRIIEKTLQPREEVDEWGNVSVQVPLVFFGNYPGTQTPIGPSLTGHGWLGGITADRDSFSLGARPGGLLDTDEIRKAFCPETVYFVVWVTPEEQMRAIEAMQRPHWTPWDNCIDHVKSALDAIHYPHPNFEEECERLGTFSSPLLYCEWILSII